MGNCTDQEKTERKRVMDEKEERRRPHVFSLSKKAGITARIGEKSVRLLVYAAVLAILGCSSFPNPDAMAVQAGNNPPEIVENHRLISDQSSEKVIDGFEQKVGRTEILERHIRLVEKITGSPLVGGNRVVLLKNGPETLDAMHQAMRKAQHHIHLETFIIRDDEVGGSIADILIKKRSEGVQVRLIHDSFGSLKTPASFFQRMKDAGIEVYEFNPVNPVDVTGNWNVNNRDHRKILVVDGRIAFTGGINFYSVYAGSPGSANISGRGRDGDLYWRDTHIQIEGPAVADFQELFLEMWGHRNEPTESGADWFPELENKGDTLVRVISSLPQQPVPHIYATYLSAIKNAGKTAHLTQAYFLPGDEMLEALAGAARRGVDVTIIVPGESDFWMPIAAGRYRYTYLLKAGVKIYERRGAVLHSKTAVVDGVWSTVGSSNLDSRSFLHDAEVNAIILSCEFADQMEAMFASDLAESDQVLLEKWRKRPLTDRLKQWFAHVFKYWL